MCAEFTEADQGKRVVNEQGNTVGVIESVERGEAHVNPDPDLGDTIRSKLGWGESKEDTYRLDRQNVATITDDEVRLSRL